MRSSRGGALRFAHEIPQAGGASRTRESCNVNGERLGPSVGLFDRELDVVPNFEVGWRRTLEEEDILLVMSQ